MRQIFPFSSIRTVTVGFGIAPNLLTPPIARRALAGFGDRSPLPPVGTFTPPRERDRRELRPTQLTHLWPIHATHLRRVLHHADRKLLHGQRPVQSSWSCPCLPTAACDLRCSGSDAPLVTPSVHPFTAAAENALTVPPIPPPRAGSFQAPSEPFPLADAMTKMGASPREAIGRRG